MRVYLISSALGFFIFHINTAHPENQVLFVKNRGEFMESPVFLYLFIWKYDKKSAIITG